MCTRLPVLISARTLQFINWSYSVLPNPKCFKTLQSLHCVYIVPIAISLVNSNSPNWAFVSTSLSFKCFCVLHGLWSLPVWCPPIYFIRILFNYQQRQGNNSTGRDKVKLCRNSPLKEN